jgi:hypothetical protein
MDDTPLLNKMDALLRKHRGPGVSAANPLPAPPTKHVTPRRAPPVGAWLPVLTDVIEPGAKGIASLIPSMATKTRTTLSTLGPADVATMVDSQLAGQLLAELAPRLSETMKKQVAEELRKSLDQTVAELLDRLDESVRGLAQDALAEKLGRPRGPTR